MIRTGLRRILETAPAIEVVGEAGTAAAARKLLATQECDVLVLDIAMPDNVGLDFLQAVHRERPRLPILVLSMYHEDVYAVRALKAGAAGYLNKASSGDELIDAVRALRWGRRYISTATAHRLVLDLQTGADGPPRETLSSRELQVLTLLGRGETVSSIGAQLHLSPRTISTYRGRLLEKLGLATTAELVRYAIRRGLDD